MVKLVTSNAELEESEEFEDLFETVSGFFSFQISSKSVSSISSYSKALLTAPMAPSYNEAIKDDGNGPISKRKRACCTIL